MCGHLSSVSFFYPSPLVALHEGSHLPTASHLRLWERLWHSALWACPSPTHLLASQSGWNHTEIYRPTIFGFFFFFLPPLSYDFSQLLHLSSAIVLIIFTLEMLLYHAIVVCLCSGIVTSNVFLFAHKEILDGASCQPLKTGGLWINFNCKFHWPSSARASSIESIAFIINSETCESMRIS